VLIQFRLKVVGDRLGKKIWDMNAPMPNIQPSGTRRRGISWNDAGIENIGCVAGADEVYVNVVDTPNLHPHPNPHPDSNWSQTVSTVSVEFV